MCHQVEAGPHVSGEAYLLHERIEFEACRIADAPSILELRPSAVRRGWAQRADPQRRYAPWSLPAAGAKLGARSHRGLRPQYAQCGAQGTRSVLLPQGYLGTAVR